MRFLKASLFLVCSVPVLYLAYLIAYEPDGLTADPVKYILHNTGLWALRFLLVTLAMTPLKTLTGRFEFIRVRRQMGLWTFFYASLHLIVYAWLDLGLDFAHLWEDIVKRPYITVGFGAWLLLLPLAITSNQKMIRKLGKTWKKLHKSIYLIVLLACLHFLWLVKKDLTEPLIYTAIALLLLAFRIKKWVKK